MKAAKLQRIVYPRGTKGAKVYMQGAGFFMLAWKQTLRHNKRFPGRKAGNDRRRERFWGEKEEVDLWKR